MKKKLKILHLEDLPFDVEMVEKTLIKASLEFEKRVVDNRVDFEEALSDFTPDVILSDHSLPSFNSTAALKIVQQLTPDIPLILVTATVSEEFAVNVLQQGATDYILKNNLQRLPAAIQSAIEKATAIREKKIAEKELKKSYQQLRKLASHLQNIREEERSAMAREIHDELGQQLTGLKLDVLWLTLKLTHADKEVQEKVKSMEGLLSASLQTVKRLATELHPAILEKLGIIEAIKWQSLEFEKRTGLKVILSLTAEAIEISAAISIALFRIYQESLTNIARHAQATMVTCSLQKWDEELFLIITDNGIGFDIKSIKDKQSLGLLGMKERTVMIGGKYEIASEPGKGTRVLVVVPHTEINL